MTFNTAIIFALWAILCGVVGDHTIRTGGWVLNACAAASALVGSFGVGCWRAYEELFWESNGKLGRFPHAR